MASTCHVPARRETLATILTRASLSLTIARYGQETEAASFLKKYPNYDGRDTIIAILDTGVDPGAAGLQVTSDGRPKIIDIVDCSGSGDIPTTTIIKATENEDGDPILTGLSGRKLRLNKDWNNPSGDYRLGIKRAYDLFPEDLQERIKAVRRKNTFVTHDVQQTLHLEMVRDGFMENGR